MNYAPLLPTCFGFFILQTTSILNASENQNDRINYIVFNVFLTNYGPPLVIVIIDAINKNSNNNNSTLL